MSPADQKQFELERVAGMMKAKGYSVSSSAIAGDRINMEVEKVFTPETVSTREVEVSWITNFLRSFGWTIEFTGYPDNRLQVKFFKVVPG